jgi:SAM-dependent methyltransferase
MTSSAMKALGNFKPVLKGALTWIPGMQRAFYDRTAGGGTAEARYCYGVWLKHLSLLWQAGMRTLPTAVAELGPGSSLGTGLAVLLSGAERYAAIDVVRHASVATTAPLLESMVELFRERAPCPAKGFPDYSDVLDARLFPSQILTDERLTRSLDAARLAELADAVRRLDAKEQHPRLRYGTSTTGDVVRAGEADVLFSHVVLCMVEDQEAFYQCCARWLKPGGWMSHQIDFTSHGITNEWNGHLQYTDAVWRIIVGQRPFFANRARLSRHLALLDKYGFEVVSVQRRAGTDGIERSQLAPRWRDMSEDDFTCAHAFIVARKPG